MFSISIGNGFTTMKFSQSKSAYVSQSVLLIFINVTGRLQLLILSKNQDRMFLHGQIVRIFVFSVEESDVPTPFPHL